ncbi:hypothetical protein GLOTRDRAFT_96911 [Gloeophyllum trabeum ATCC 11539]|uniref:Uncharacterized protein n=1 Tax=Gloeophyllum trabeum (strain ATCC 11539 / FP-39264 / Madison 617) TaxID=670483 RepID=S7PTB6_GLOTA|nr:uncharacterized protein GLOTRDRAFT_96911 [Gloeophyllum trabeum ATCC 11539]EPQ50663.1 hypothetical protein GLOTRDRAFT_96911 [Gloeophyllum trabeum ATCC 11539]
MHAFEAETLGFKFESTAFQAIIKTLLEWFHGYYDVHEGRVEDVAKFVSKDNPTSTKRLYDVPERWRSKKNREVVSEEEKHEGYAKLARNLDDHTQMMDLLRDAFHKSVWPEQDKMPDQLEPKYKHQVFSMQGASRSTSKRTASQVFEPESDHERNPKMLRSSTGSRS